MHEKTITIRWTLSGALGSLPESQPDGKACKAEKKMLCGALAHVATLTKANPNATRIVFENVQFDALLASVATFPKPHPNAKEIACNKKKHKTITKQ